MTMRPVKFLMLGDKIWLPPPYDCVATVTDLKPLVIPSKRIGKATAKKPGLYEMDIRAESGWKAGMNIRGQVRGGNEALFVGSPAPEAAP